MSLRKVHSRQDASTSRSPGGFKSHAVRAVLGMREKRKRRLHWRVPGVVLQQPQAMYHTTCLLWRCVTPIALPIGLLASRATAVNLNTPVASSRVSQSLSLVMPAWFFSTCWHDRPSSHCPPTAAANHTLPATSIQRLHICDCWFLDDCSLLSLLVDVWLCQHMNCIQQVDAMINVCRTVRVKCG
jgi:hypothetical protein